MKDCSAMSDFEINLAVAHIALGKGNYDWSAEKKEVYRAGMDGGEFLPNAYFDSCNNPADAWSIILENGIGLRKQSNGLWCATMMGGVNPQYDKNPLRAAMIVFLMIKAQEAENAKTSE